MDEKSKCKTAAKSPKGDAMNIIRSTLMICITILLSVSMTLLYFYTEERFDIVKSKDGVFVFDRKTTSLNYCTKQKCSLISPRFIHKSSYDDKLISSPCSPQMNSYPPSYAVPNPQMLPPPGYVMPQPWYPAPISGATHPAPKPLLPQTTANSSDDDEDDSGSQGDSPSKNTADSSDADDADE